MYYGHEVLFGAIREEEVGRRWDRGPVGDTTAGCKRTDGWEPGEEEGIRETDTEEMKEGAHIEEGKENE